jgi:hypothetical protein
MSGALQAQTSQRAHRVIVLRDRRPPIIAVFTMDKPQPRRATTPMRCMWAWLYLATLERIHE